MKKRDSLEATSAWARLNRPQAEGPDVAMFALPYDGAACFRAGAAKGPDRIRSLSSEIPPVLETGQDLKNLLVRDFGNIPFGNNFVASYPKIEEMITQKLEHSFVLTLGGDHSIAIPVHRAFSQKATEPIGLIFIDAHTDLSDQFQGSAYSNACPLRRTMETASFSPENTILVGTRCFEPAGLSYIQDHKIKIYPAHIVAERGIFAVASEIVQHLSGLSNVYLSIDIDVLDPAFAPGTGIPDAGGLTTRELMTLIRAMDALPVVGADLVEVAPNLDVSDVTSFAALRVIMEILGLVDRRKIRLERYTLL